MKKRKEFSQLNRSYDAEVSKDELTLSLSSVNLDDIITFSSSGTNVITKNKRNNAVSTCTTSEDSDSDAELSERKVLKSVNPNKIAKRYGKVMQDEDSIRKSHSSEDFTDDKWSKYLTIGSGLPKDGSKTSRGF